MPQTELAAANAARSGRINTDCIIKPGRQLREEAENGKKTKHFGTSKTTNDKTVAADLTTPLACGRLSGDESEETGGAFNSVGCGVVHVTLAEAAFRLKVSSIVQQKWNLQSKYG